MKVKELIEALKEFPEDSELRAYGPDHLSWAVVNVIPGFKNKTVIVYDYNTASFD